MTKLKLPGSTIGIIGGGQLGQMMALSAKEMGFFVGVLDPTSDCPASQVSDWSITADYDDQEAIKRLVEKSDLITYEFENVDAEVIEKYVPKEMLPQGIQLLKISQNRGNEKHFLSELNLPLAPYKLIATIEELREAVKEINYPCVLKTCCGGYDGKGQVVLKSVEDLSLTANLIENQVCVLESWVDFDKEISVIVAGSSSHQYELFPISENRHQNNILKETLVPANISKKSEEKAKEIGLQVAKALNIRGTIAIEMFVKQNGEIMINEIAPRPHNSGHYSIEACNVSQFDQHIRGICGWPLPKVNLHQEAIMLNLIGEEAIEARTWISQKKDWYFHFYGKKEVKDGRKMGHVTLLTKDREQSLKEIEEIKLLK